jgi:hypothetical protein
MCELFAIFVCRDLFLERGNNLPLSDCIAACYDYIIIASGYAWKQVAVHGGP